MIPRTAQPQQRQEAPETPPPAPVRRRMTAWFDPRLLLAVGAKAAISSLVGSHADTRLLEAQEGADGFAPLSFADREELWLDYVADTGDGWDSTYGVASTVARPDLAFGPVRTRRGDLLVLGGDQVYPSASKTAYDERLRGPFQAALAQAGDEAKRPALAALPGNHDWYDGLVSFRRLFTQARSVGGWKTFQRCSYWAIRLPHHWWLLGVDLQLSSDVDRKQIEYFRTIAEQLDADPASRVILCTPEPYWVAEADAPAGVTPARNNIRFFEEHVLRRSASVVLAGDLHHYRRQSDGERPLVTAGGGGAFLHPTHVPEKARLDQVAKVEHEYPARSDSSAAARRLLLPWAILRNSPAFALVTGAIYWMTSRLIEEPLHTAAQASGLFSPVGILLQACLQRPSLLLWLLVVAGALVGYAGMGYRHGGRLWAGLAHLAGHLAAIGAVSLAFFSLEMQRGSLAYLAAHAGITGAAGLLLGPWIVGIYLFLAMRLHGAHANEAFSALAIPDWKSFIRLHIDKEGRLRIYPIAIDRVPRRWKENPAWQRDRSEPRYVADDPDATEPRLIETPISVPPISTPPISTPGASR